MVNDREKRGCRECGHDDYHHFTCSFFKERLKNYGPVAILESERSPERQANQSILKCPQCGREGVRSEAWAGYSNFWCVPCGWRKRVDDSLEPQAVERREYALMSIGGQMRKVSQRGGYAGLTCIHGVPLDVSCSGCDPVIEHLQPEAPLCGECGHAAYNEDEGRCTASMPDDFDGLKYCGHRCTFPVPVVEAEQKWQVVSWGYEDATVTDGVTYIQIKDSAYQRPLDQSGRPKLLAFRVAAALNELPVEADAVAETPESVALAELQELFPDSDPRVQVYVWFKPKGYRGAIYEFGETLSEAMQKVREYAERINHER